MIKLGSASTCTRRLDLVDWLMGGDMGLGGVCEKGVQGRDRVQVN